MIKVLHVVPTLGYGGVAKVVCNYNEVINHSEFRFDFVTHGKEEDYHTELIAQGSKIYYFQTIGKVGKREYLEQISKQIELRQYDIVHIHVGDITGIYAGIYRQGGAKKIICHAHTTQAVSKTHKYFEWMLRRLAVKRADYCIACGEDAGRFCFGKGRYTVLKNSIDFEKFYYVPQEEIKSVRKELNLPEDKKIIGHVGFFSAPKNHTFLLEIFSELLRRYPDVILLLVGQGPDLERMKQKVLDLKIESNVIFCGIRKDVKVLMKIFDLFVLPSLHEGLPVVGIEAQTAGLNCILSDQIDAQVDIGCGEVVMLPIDQGTECWVESILNIFQNPSQISPLKIKKALKDSGYDIIETVDILADIYKSVVAK